MKRIIIATLVVLLAGIIACKKKDTFTSNETSISIKTLSISNLTLTSAASGGEFLSYGNDSIVEKGICWSTTENPTISATKTVDGSNSGNFVSSMTGLTPMTYYFVRAYATTKSGTVYGTQVKFITSLTPTTVPALTTTAVTNITNTSANSGGTIISDSGYVITSRGVCWSTITQPTIADSKTSNGTGTGTFISLLPNLLPNTTYYIRAYATNVAGTGYGNEITLTTSNVSTALPHVTTSPVKNIISDRADCGGNVDSLGGSAVIARGVCWSKNANPTLADNFTTNGNGIGAFNSALTGLTGNTTYHVRAYATNSAGTAYGNEFTFTTSPATLATITTTTVTGITETSAISGGNISTDGGSAVTARGVCWSTSPNPTTSNSKTIDGSGIGTYNSSLAGLSSATTYYVRAYATNGMGTVYGNQVTFITLRSGCGTTVTDIDGNIYSVVQIGSQCWTRPNLRVTKFNNGDPIPNVTGNPQWAALSTEGYCYYNNVSSTSVTGATYGPLYNWYAVNDSRNLCPAGWHVATKGEWNTLITFLGGPSLAGRELKEAGTAHWFFGAGASNSTTFTALPASFRNGDGSFPIVAGTTQGYSGNFWSSTQDSIGTANSIDMVNTTNGASTNIVVKTKGESVRCIKN